MRYRSDGTAWCVEGATRDRQSITADWQLLGQDLIDGVTFREIRPVATGYGHLTEMFRAEWADGNADVGQVFTSTFGAGGVSAWHAHARTTDRLFVAQGMALVVLYDQRPGSPTEGKVNRFRFGAVRPALLTVPPQVWHGVRNTGDTGMILINAVDIAYSYEDPDHWRVPPDSPSIPTVI